MLSNELLNVAPFLQPYLKAAEKAITHIVNNFHLIQNGSSSQDVFREAAMIFLSTANITVGNFYDLNEAAVARMIRDIVKMMIDMEIFGHAPMVYQALEQFVASDYPSMIAQMTEMIAWLASNQASGLDLLTQALPKIYDILRPLWSLMTQENMDMSAFMKLLEDLVGNILAMLKQFVATSDLLAPMAQHRTFQHEMAGGNHVMRHRQRREAQLQPLREPMDDFIKLLYIDYPAMFRAISVPPTAAEIQETIHVFVANPDLKVVLTGATHGMPWALNASREETINAAIGMLSFLTYPGIYQR